MLHSLYLHVGLHTVGTQKTGPCPGVWGTEAGPEMVRSEPKLKVKYELLRLQVSEVG